MPQSPRSLPLAPFMTIRLRITAPRARTPSTERSIEPIRMTKVAPSPRTSGIIAAWQMRTKLEKLRKLGLIAAMMAHSTTSTTTGAQGPRRSRRRPRVAARPAVTATAPLASDTEALPPPAQPYWICPLTRPQMSFQSSLGSALMLLA